MVQADSTPAPSKRRQRLKFALAVLGVALAFGILESAQGRFLRWYLTDREFWPEAFARTIPSWLIMAALFPMVYFLARRFSFSAGGWRIALPVHILGGFVFVFLHLGGSAVVAGLRHVTVVSIQQAFFNYIEKYTMVDFFMYGALVGMVQIAQHRSEIRQREHIESSLRADLAEARLATLRHQLHPHFLFNTLNSISALALTGDRDTLLRAVDSLSSLLRTLLEQNDRATTSLADEMAFLDRYCEIQSIRFGERLTIVREVPEETLGAEVPALILQPLVENAMRHGIESRPGPGWVAIRARREPQWLRLEVEDSGPGFPTAADGAATAGLGLANTRARLEQLYGSRCVLECSNGSQTGAHVVMRIPWALRSADTTVESRA
jgi:LytS/YehU family sensor histidine kinase